MRRGAISYSKVRAITRVATPETEERLLEFARCATAAHVERLVRAWRRVDRIAEAEDDRRRHASRHLDTWVDEDGMLVLRGRLSPEVGAVVQRALEAASDRLYHQAEDTTEASDAPERESAAAVTVGQRRADALGLLAESALAADLDRGTAGDRYQVVVHVDADGLKAEAEGGQSALEDGIGIPAGTSRRIACDASAVVMTHDRDGRTLDVGRKTRTIPPAIRRALTARDRRCRFPGCGARQCDAHHVDHWADGGATRLDNLVLLCRRHHRAVHEEGFTVELRDDGEAHFRWPNGRPFPDAPPAPTWEGAPLVVCPTNSWTDLPERGARLARRDEGAYRQYSTEEQRRQAGCPAREVSSYLWDTPLAATNQDLAASGITIDSHTATPDWHGEPLDLHWAITVLHPSTADPAHGDVTTSVRSKMRM